MDCRTLIAHPKLPILHVLTADGRVLVIAISVKVKGQLISKGNFSAFNSPKNELENVNFCPSLSTGAEIFLGELKNPKSPFEIK